MTRNELGADHHDGTLVDYLFYSKSLTSVEFNKYGLRPSRLLSSHGVFLHIHRTTLNAELEIRRHKITGLIDILTCKIKSFLNDTMLTHFLFSRFRIETLL